MRSMRERTRAEEREREMESVLKKFRWNKHILHYRASSWIQKPIQNSEDPEKGKGKKGAKIAIKLIFTNSGSDSAAAPDLKSGDALQSGGAVVVAVAAVVEVLRVANGVVLEGNRLRRLPAQALPLAQNLPDQPPQLPSASSAAAAGNSDARVLLVHRDARRRHASGEVRRPPMNDVTHFPVAGFLYRESIYEVLVVVEEERRNGGRLGVYKVVGKGILCGEGLTFILTLLHLPWAHRRIHLFIYLLFRTISRALNVK